MSQFLIEILSDRIKTMTSYNNITSNRNVICDLQDSSNRISPKYRDDKTLPTVILRDSGQICHFRPKIREMADIFAIFDKKYAKWRTDLQFSTGNTQDGGQICHFRPKTPKMADIFFIFDRKCSRWRTFFSFSTGTAQDGGHFFHFRQKMLRISEIL